MTLMETLSQLLLSEETERLVFSDIIILLWGGEEEDGFIICID